jgi:hypothetical protein
VHVLELRDVLWKRSFGGVDITFRGDFALWHPDEQLKVTLEWVVKG